jgi:hypothetical protein
VLLGSVLLGCELLLRSWGKLLAGKSRWCAMLFFNLFQIFLKSLQGFHLCLVHLAVPLAFILLAL